MRKIMIGLIIALVLVGSGFSSRTAQAADTYAYVVVNNRVCGTPGVQVRRILANVQPTGWTTRSYDSGDNIVYPRVRLYQRNQFSAEVECYKRVYFFWWTPVGFRTVVGYFTPTKANQTFWVG